MRCASAEILNPPSPRVKFAQIIGVNCVDRHEKYLGVPTIVGRNCSLHFGYIKDRLEKWLHSWKRKLMSAAGKDLLVKTIAQAILIYTISTFLLLKFFYDDLNDMIAKYFPNQSFLDMPVKPKASYYWKSICAARKIIKLGCLWQLSVRSPPDTLTWFYKKNGMLSMGKAYHLARFDSKPSNNGASSSLVVNQVSRFWDQPWLAMVPPIRI
ncbi:hypothetical protein ACFXTI_032365 [Malus domestica]